MDNRPSSERQAREAPQTVTRSTNPAGEARPNLGVRAGPHNSAGVRPRQESSPAEKGAGFLPLVDCSRAFAQPVGATALDPGHADEVVGPDHRQADRRLSSEPDLVAAEHLPTGGPDDFGELRICVGGDRDSGQHHGEDRTWSTIRAPYEGLERLRVACAARRSAR